jgi:enterochelin esterase-like enzyme
MCYVYEPASFPTAALYVQDGEAFYQKLALHQVADALLERKEIEPVRIVFLEPRDRVAEYWFNQRYESFLLEELLPFIEQNHGPTALRGLWGGIPWRNGRRLVGLETSRSFLSRRQPIGVLYC